MRLLFLSLHHKPDIKCHFLLLLFCHNSKYFVCFPFFFFDLHKTKKEIWYLVIGWCNKRNINKLSEKNFMLINVLLPFSVLLLSKFEDWNNNLDASLFGMISFSFIRNSNWNLRPLVEIHTGLTDLWKFGKVLKSILDVFFCFCFPDKNRTSRNTAKEMGK